MKWKKKHHGVYLYIMGSIFGMILGFQKTMNKILNFLSNDRYRLYETVKKYGTKMRTVDTKMIKSLQKRENQNRKETNVLKKENNSLINDKNIFGNRL